MKSMKPWTGKKDNLPSPVKKEQHLERKSKRELQHHFEDDDWNKQLQEYYASQQVQEQFQ